MTVFSEHRLGGALFRDKYGRGVKIDGVLENIYDVNPTCAGSSYGICKIKSESNSHRATVAWR